MAKVAPVAEYRIAPEAHTPDFDLAGAGNSFGSFHEAEQAAISMDHTNRLEDGGEWCVYERIAGEKMWTNLTR